MIKKLSMSEATNQSLILLGSSHQVADLSAREKISLPAESIDDFYKGLGQINGIVERISPDTEQDENDNRIVFYNIFVELDQNYFESKEKIYYLVPGVKVTASIQIGERTLANYLLSPFIGSLGQSFQER